MRAPDTQIPLLMLVFPACLQVWLARFSCGDSVVGRHRAACPGMPREARSRLPVLASAAPRHKDSKEAVTSLPIF